MARKSKQLPAVSERPAMSQGESASLSIVQLQAAEHIANGETDSEVARRVRRDRKTISRWHDNPLFEAEVDRLVRLRRRRLRNRVEAAAIDAITSVREIATTKVKDPETGEEHYAYDAERRTAATRVILQHAIPTREEVEVSGPEGGPIPVEVTSQSVTLELSKLWTKKEGT